MVSHNRAPPLLREAYRVVVRASEATRRKGFIWQIVRDTAQSCQVTAVSDGSFRTMEEAHAQGSVSSAGTKTNLNDDRRRRRLRAKRPRE